MSQVVLLIIDLQNDFLDSTSHEEIGKREKAFCVPGAERLLLHAEEAHWQVIHVHTVHIDVDSLPTHMQRKGVPIYCEEGTLGAKPVLLPKDGSIPIEKQHFSAFRGTDLVERLSGKPKRPSLVLAGVALDCCILSTAFDADALGYHCYVPLGAVSASTPEACVFGLQSLSKSSAHIVSLPRILAGSDLDDAVIPEGDIADACKDWFAKQEEKLSGLPLDEPLDDVLVALRKEK
jgi:nicotinamidase-related amidase